MNHLLKGIYCGFVNLRFSASEAKVKLKMTRYHIVVSPAFCFLAFIIYSSLLCS